jgi:hypothetical protein
MMATIYRNLGNDLMSSVSGHDFTWHMKNFEVVNSMSDDYIKSLNSDPKQLESSAPYLNNQQITLLTPENARTVYNLTDK